MSHVVFIAGNARSLIANRGDLVATLRQSGHQVTALVPSYDMLPELDDLGIPYEPVILNRTHMNPWKDFFACMDFRRRLRRLAPDVAFSYTIKPVVYGSLAARLARVPRIVSMITGLGYLFTGDTWRQRLGRRVAMALYAVALPLNDVVIFQNADDRRLFENAGLLRRCRRVVTVPGSGVNLEHFRVAPLPEGPLRFLLVARLLRDKGIAEFVQAAGQLKVEYPEAQFEILGPHDPNLHGSIPPAQLDAWKTAGQVVFHPGVKDIRPHLARCSVFVLPSYREGTPRSVLEAMAMGRAVITTEAPGCRETVSPGVNGFLVPPRQAAPLAEAMRRFLRVPRMVSEMGLAGRRVAEEKYDVRAVNREMIACLMGPEVA